MKKFFTSLCSVIGSIALIIAILILSIEMFVMNRGFFESEYSKLGTAQSIGMSEQDLSKVTDNLLSYTEGNRDSLDMEAKINGITEEVFGEREKDHMVDVRNMFITARLVRTVCLIAAAVFIAAAFIISRKKAVRSLCISFTNVSIAFLFTLAVLGLYAVIDFTSFWTHFHYLFFSNNLWMLDPRTDILIMMVPEQFFSDLIIRIAIRFVSIFAALNIAAIVGNSIYKKRRRLAKQPQEINEA